VVFLGSAIAVRRGAHIAILLLPDRLRNRAREWVRLGIAACSLGFSAVLAVVGLQVSLAARDIPSPAMQIPLSSVYLAVPVGALVMIAWGLAEAWTVVKGLRA
jgi:TRAP-type C4-dicarboxylate transport system permease small subunit